MVLRVVPLLVVGAVHVNPLVRVERDKDVGNKRVDSFLLCKRERERERGSNDVT